MKKLRWFALVLALSGCVPSAKGYSTSCNSIRLISNRIPCSSFLSTDELDSIVREQSETVKEVEGIGPDGQVEVMVGPVNECAGKSGMLVGYASVEQCQKIKGVIGGDTFFGSPYGLFNW